MGSPFVTTQPLLSMFANRRSKAGSMGNLRRDRAPLIGDDLASNTLFWLLLGQIGSAIFGSICQLRPSNLYSVIGSSLRGAADSIFSLFSPNQRQVHHWVQAQVPFKEIPNISSVWSDGAILCVIVENAIAPNSTDYHTEKYRAYGHMTIPTIKLGQKLAEQYLSVTPEFKVEEMKKEADPEIILRLVKYLQNVKQASKVAKRKKPIENERRLTLKERLDEAQKVQNPKPEILRKKRIIHRKRRSKIPKKAAALNYSFVSSTVIKDSDDPKEKEALENLQNDSYLEKCHEIKSVCEMLLIRSSKSKSLTIFNKATQILSSRRSSTSQPLEDSEHLELMTAEEEKKLEAIIPIPERKMSITLTPPTVKERKSSVEKIQEPTPIIVSEDSSDNFFINDNWTKDEFIMQPNWTRQPGSPVLNTNALSPKPYSRASSPKLDFSKTNFSLLKISENSPKIVQESKDAPEDDHSKEVPSNVDVRAGGTQLPDIANLNINEDNNSGIFFARRLSNSFFKEDNKQVENPLYQVEKIEPNNSHKNNNISSTDKAYKGVKARRKYFQEQAQAASQSKSHQSTQVDDKAEKLALAMKNETKKRYEEVKNFFKTMEQNSMEVTEQRISRQTSKRSSDTSSLLQAKEPPLIRYMSCRVKKPAARLKTEEVFAPEESPKVIKTMQKASPSALMASLNSAYEEQMGRSISPYDIVREEEDDSEPPSSPDFHVPDLVQRRVSFSQLNQEGDAGIF